MSRVVFTGVVVALTACSVDLAPLEEDGGITAIGGANTGGSGNTGVGATGGTGAGGVIGFDGGADTGTGGTGDPCGDCIADVCASANDMCLSDANCSTLASCLGSCADPSCQESCYNVYGDGSAAYYALVSCTYQSCPTECYWTEPCQSCELTNCLSSKYACLQDFDCLAYWYCVATCSDQTCYDRCYTDFPDGALKSDTYNSCSLAYCEVVCGW